MIDYLSNVHSIPQIQLVQDFESIGFEFKGGSKDGRFMEFVDKYSNTRVKIHPPDNVGTDYHHIHIYDKSGNSLNSRLVVVSYKSPEAHIKITDSYEVQAQLKDGLTYENK